MNKVYGKPSIQRIDPNEVIAFAACLCQCGKIYGSGEGC